MTTKDSSPAVIASIVLPLIVVIAFWTTINSPISEDPSKLPVEIQEIDNRLAETNPDVILVGSSLVNRAVNNDTFAKQLGLEEDKVQKLWSGMATMPAVSLMIENRILAQNLQPKVVAILCPPSWLTETEILQDANFATHQTRPLSPLLADVLGRETEATPSPWKQRKSDFQNGYQEWNQEIFGEMMLGESKESIDEQLDGLFAAENQRKNVKGNQLIQHNIRETEETREQENTSNRTFDLRLLDYIAQQLHERNIQLVVVILPVSRTVKDTYALNDAQMIELVNTLQKHEASFVDLYDWNERNVFGDTKHMNARGRKLFTPLLAQKWLDLGVLTDTPAVATASVKLLKPEVSKLNNGRLQPNTAIDLTFPLALSKGVITACVSSDSPVEGTVFTQSKDRTGAKNVWCEKIQLSNITEGQTISLQNQIGAPVHVHSLQLDNTELLEQPNSILAEMKDWTLDQSKPSKRFPINEAAQWPKWLTKKKTTFPALQVGELSRYKGLSDVALAERGIPLECRPLQVWKGKETLPLTKCKDVWNTETGYCINTKNLITIQDAPVAWDTLSIGIKENRLCHLPKRKVPAGYWVFPSDSSSTVFNWPKGDYSRIHLEGTSIGKGAWRVELFEGDTVFLDRQIETPLEKELELLLDAPMLKKHTKLQIRISVPKDSNTNLFIQRIEVKN